MSDNNIILHASGNKLYTCEADVHEAWAKNIDFATPFEFYAYMRRTDYEQFGNKMDGVIFNDQGLHVILKTKIV